MELNIKTKVDISNAEKATDSIEKGAKKSEGAVSSLTNQLDKMTGGAISGFKGMVGGLKNGVKGFKTLKGAIAATGIGLLIVAVGSLISYFKSTQEGADKIDKAFAAIGATIDVLVDRLSSFGSGLFEIMSGNFSEGLDILAGSFKGITQEIKEEVKAAVELEGASQGLLKTKREFIEQEAKLNADLEKYRLASENFDLSTSERLKANTKAQETAMLLAEKRAAIAKEELRVLTEKNSLGNSLNDDLDAEAEAKARLFEIEGQRDALAKEFQAKAKSITDEQKSASAAKAAQDKADREKKAAEDLVAAKEQADKVEASRLEAIKKSDNELREYKLEKEELELERLLEFYDRQRELELQALDLTEAEKEAIRLTYKEKEAEANKQINAKIAADNKKKDDKDLAIAQANADAKLSLLNSVFQIGSMLGDKSVGIAKGIAVAQAGINTYQGVTAALAQTTDVTPTQSLRFANAAAVGVAGLLNVKKILSTNTKSKSAPSVSSGGSGGGSAPTVPDFSFVNQGVGGTDNASIPTPRAYVVNQDIKDQSALDSRINDLAKI